MTAVFNQPQLIRYMLTCSKRIIQNKVICSSNSNICKYSSLPISDHNQIAKQKKSPGVISSGFHKSKHAMDVPESLFHGVEDRFNGITVDSKKEFNEKDDIVTKLQKSLDFWIENGRRCIWFKVCIEHSQMIPELTKRGFDFHHAKNGYVMLYRWLPTTESANIPVYAHTLVGVGGLVVNHKNEVLVVSERYALIPNSWKLPGGYVEPKEDLVDAAIREIREETGVETTFDTVIAVRQSHGSSFSCSDLYFVIALKPITTNLTACPREISKVEWMPVSDYLENPNVHETNRHFVRTYLHYKEAGIRFNCLSATHQVLNRKYCVFTAEKQNDNNHV